MTKACIIGGGIGGLATAILLAKKGYDVELVEKLPELGGRARQFKIDGFTFDSGPSWYLMPEVFEHYFQLIGEDIHEHLELQRLDPAYKVFFDTHKPLTVYGDLERDAAQFESVEFGAGEALRSYIETAESTYEQSTKTFLYSNFGSIREFLKPSILKRGSFMLKRALQPLDSYVSKYFHDQRLKQILEYPMVFLGASPFTAPSLYHLMSCMDFKEGVFYPKGGIYKLIESLIKIAEREGVNIQTGRSVKEIKVSNGIATGVRLDDDTFISSDVIISNADIHFTETKLLDKAHQSYSAEYWQSRTTGPSALLMYLGVKGKLPQLEHHNLYFTEKWHENFASIFDDKVWPNPASIYICKPSATDNTVAPKGHENIFVLVPGPSTKTSPEQLEILSKQYLNKIKQVINEPELEAKIVVKKLYGPDDFENDYNSWQGSALGLSHTLSQSAFLRTKNKSKKVKNLYYVGGNTIPGIGLPMCLISAELVYKHLIRDTSSGPLRVESAA